MTSSRARIVGGNRASRADVITTLLWDFDGTIVDTERADAIAWCEEFARAGVPVSDREYAAWWLEWALHRAVPMIDRLAARAPGTDREAVQARRLSRYQDLCAELPARPGVAAWMEQARRLGLRQAVVTNDISGRAAAHLARVGLDRYIEVTAAAGSGARPKPFPDLYDQALAVLGVTPGEAVAVEDSPHGVTAALAAGIPVIAIPTAVSRLLDLSAASTPVGDAAGTRLEDVLAVLDGPHP